MSGTRFWTSPPGSVVRLWYWTVLAASFVATGCAQDLNTTSPATTTTEGYASVSICKEGGKGTFFPAVDNEHEWPAGLRIVLYLFGLFWMFAGVGMYADSFMGAIEEITSSEVVVTDKETQQQERVKIWNPTVANLTLMALGSSAPEILLAIIEIVAMNQFYSGELGPSTIVGSAAFNLLVIIAVCTMSLTEVKRISQFQVVSGAITCHTVYVVTAIFSVFAYGWLLIILIAISPDIISVAEAVITLLFFPVLVVISWLFDQRQRKAEKGKLESTDGKTIHKDAGIIEAGGNTFRRGDAAKVEKIENEIIELRRKLGKVADPEHDAMTEEEE